MVHLIESNQRKAAFLRAATRATKAPAAVHEARAEQVVSRWSAPLDAISARAFAPLSTLVPLLAPLSVQGVPAYLHKGAEFAAELEAVAADWRFDLLEHKSRIGPGIVAELRHIRRQPGPVRIGYGHEPSEDTQSHFAREPKGWRR